MTALRSGVPDASLMVYSEFNIQVSQGTTADGEAGYFVPCGAKWLYGRGSECGDLTLCTEVPIVHRGEMTILMATNVNGASTAAVVAIEDKGMETLPRFCSDSGGSDSSATDRHLSSSSGLSAP